MLGLEGGPEWRGEGGTGEDMRGRLDILNESACNEEEEDGRRRGGRKGVGFDKTMETTLRKMEAMEEMVTM